MHLEKLPLAHLVHFLEGFDRRKHSLSLSTDLPKSNDVTLPRHLPCVLDYPPAQNLFTFIPMEEVERTIK